MIRAAALLLAALPLAARAQSPPALSGISAAADASGGAVVSWTTDRPADAEVDHGPTSAYGASVSSRAFEEAHALRLAGLPAGATHHFRVKSRGPEGLLSVSGDFTFTAAPPAPTEVSTAPGAAPIVVIMNPQPDAVVSGSVTVSANATAGSGLAIVQFLLDGGDIGAPLAAGPYTFAWNTPLVSDGAHTLAAVARDKAGRTATSPIVRVTVDNVPPLISELSASAVSSDGAVILWTTNERADSQVEYGTTPEYGMSSPPNASLVVSRAVALSGLAPATLHHYRVKSRDAAGVLSVSGDAVFTTAAAGGAGPAAAPEIPARAPQRILTPARADGINDRAVFGPQVREVSIVNLRGRRVFQRTSSGPGIVWDCRDGGGNFVASGVYIAHLVTEDSKDLYQSFAVAK